MALRLDGGPAQAVASDGPVTLSSAATAGSSYAVTVAQQPTQQRCTVVRGSGSALSADVSDVRVSCYDIPNGIALNSGAVLSGYTVRNPSGPCISVSNAARVTIADNTIGPCQDGRNGVGISLYASSEVKVLNNRFSDVASGVYAVQMSSGRLLIEGNTAQKVRGPGPRGQFVQLNKVSGPDIAIRCNTSDQAIGGYGSGPEDHISLYQSAGTPASPILVEGNRLRGGGSQSGGGIMSGDGGFGADILVTDNTLVDAGQYGLAVAGGTRIQLRDNRVFAARHPWTNVGIYVWAQGTPTPACSAITVAGNRVNYTNAAGQSNPWWNAGNCGAVAMTPANVFGDASLSAAAWDAPIAACATPVAPRF